LTPITLYGTASSHMSGRVGSRFRRSFFSERAGVALTILVVLSSGGAAKGADSVEAETLIRQGLELRQQGRDERALPLFQKAYDLVATPRTAGQLGFAEMAVGYWLDAEQHVSLALESPEHPWVAKNLATLKQALAQIRTNIGEIVVDGPPDGATLTVNRHPAGTFPLPGPIRVAKGSVNIEVTAPRYHPTTRMLRITGSERQQIVMNLVKIADEAAVSPTSPPVGLATKPSLEPQPGAPVPADPTMSSLGSDRSGLSLKVGWGIGLGIGAAAALVGAVIETVIWQRRRSQFNSLNSGCFEDQPDRGGAGCSSIYDSTRSAMTLSLIGYVGAAALAAGSAALLLTAKRSEQNGAAVAVVCAPSLGAALVRCSLTF
jgi:hypothetical protein